MIEKLSNRLADYLLGQGIIEHEYRVVYLVGIDVMLSAAIQVLTILAAGAFLYNLSGAVLFLLCFMTIRAYSGGFHATTRTRCVLTMAAGYGCTAVGAGWIAKIPRAEIMGSLVFILDFNFAVFFKFVPVKNNTKILEENWREDSRKKLFYMLAAWKVASVVLIPWFVRLTIQLFLVELVTAVLILACRPWSRQIKGLNEVFDEVS